MAIGKYFGDDNPDGCSFGQSATSKIGFYGKTPVVQPAVGADGTDAATVLTLVNAIKTALVSQGLVKA